MPMRGEMREAARGFDREDNPGNQGRGAVTGRKTVVTNCHVAEGARSS